MYLEVAEEGPADGGRGAAGASGAAPVCVPSAAKLPAEDDHAARTHRGEHSSG